MTAASGSGSTVRSALSRAMTTESGDPAASADSRDVITRPASAKRVPVSPSMAADTKPGAASADDESATASGKRSGMCAPSSWSNIRMTIRIVGLSSNAASAAFRFAEVVVAGQDDDRGGLDLGLAQDARQAWIADHEPGADLGQVLFGVGRRPDPDDDLVAGSQFVDRPHAEVVETADDRMTGGRHPRSLRGGDGRIRP